MADEHDSNENIEYKILRHDLYNPINQIVGYSELLSEELDAGESIDPEDLNKIGKSARTLLEHSGCLCALRTLGSPTYCVQGIMHSLCGLNLNHHGD